MLRSMLKRLSLLIPTLFGVVTLVFAMIALSPGDPARVMLGERATRESVEKLRRDLGLDKPLIQQYGSYLARIVVLDFQRSIKTGQKVIDEIGARFPATIELSICAMIFAAGLGILLGILSATRKNTWVDYASMVSALTGVSMPIFWLGLILMLIFSIALNILPTSGRIDLRLYFKPVTNFYLIDSLIYLVRDGNPAYLGSVIRHLILPSITLGTIPMAIIARITRSSMLEVLKQDYIKTARAAGIPERTVIYRYALRNALLPVITVIGLEFGLLLSGAILTETIFAWPGIGKWIYNAIEARDYPAVQGGIIVIATVFVAINLLVDMLYSVVNPKIRLS
jgi:ABC-type dipeptide/oligopeptide/nickel transport system permease component